MTLNLKQIKLLYIMKILLEKTDEEHPITINEITASNLLRHHG